MAQFIDATRTEPKFSFPSTEVMMADLAREGGIRAMEFDTADRASYDNAISSPPPQLLAPQNVVYPSKDGHALSDMSNAFLMVPVIDPALTTDLPTCYTHTGLLPQFTNHPGDLRTYTYMFNAGPTAAAYPLPVPAYYHVDANVAAAHLHHALGQRFQVPPTAHAAPLPFPFLQSHPNPPHCPSVPPAHHSARATSPPASQTAPAASSSSAPARRPILPSLPALAVRRAPKARTEGVLCDRVFICGWAGCDSRFECAPDAGEARELAFQRSLRAHLLGHAQAGCKAPRGERCAWAGCGDAGKSALGEPRALVRHLKRHIKAWRVFCGFCDADFTRADQVAGHVKGENGGCGEYRRRMAAGEVVEEEEDETAGEGGGKRKRRAKAAGKRKAAGGKRP